MTIGRRVWGIGTPRTLRPQWALIELGLDYDHKKILPRGEAIEDPDLLAMSQRHKVPFYADDRVQMGESAAIVTYLCKRYGDKDQLPMPAPGTADRAVLYHRLLFVMTEIDARMYTVRLHAGPPQGLSNVYGAAPEAVEAAKVYADRQLLLVGRDARTFSRDVLFVAPVPSTPWAQGFLELFRNRGKNVRLFQPLQCEAPLDWITGN